MRKSDVLAHRVATLDLLSTPDPEICTRLSISPNQLSKIRSSPSYSSAITSISSASVTTLTDLELSELVAARRTLFSALSSAVSQLLDLINSPDTPPAVRLNAIRTLFGRTGLTQKAIETAILGSTTQGQGQTATPELIDSLSRLVQAIKEDTHTTYVVEPAATIEPGG